MRRVQALLTTAERSEQRYRLAAAPWSKLDQDRAKGWAEEVTRLEKRLRALLGALGRDAA